MSLGHACPNCFKVCASRRVFLVGRFSGEDEASKGPGLLGSLLHAGLHQLTNFHNKLTAFPNCFTSINRAKGKIRTLHV